MKKIILILILFSFSLSVQADVCPSSNGLNPEHPPAGWDLGFSPPYDPTLQYEFGQAAHYFNGDDNYNKILCKYEVCPGFGCFYFILISQNRYKKPYYSPNPPSPWFVPYHSRNILECRPGGDRPELCVFSDSY